MAMRETAQQIASLLKMLAPWTATDLDDAVVGLIVHNIEDDAAWSFIVRIISALTPEQAGRVAERLGAVETVGFPLWLTVLINLLMSLLGEQAAGAVGS